VSIDVIPAIDVAGGRLARYAPHGPTPLLDAYGGDPVAAARAFVDAGARWLHVVDMDLAFGGRPGNIEVIAELARMPARVQASGGVVRSVDADALLEAGAARVVLGSGTLGDPALLERLLAHHGDRVAVGVDVEAGDRIRSRGRSPLDLAFDDAMATLSALAPPRLLVTAVPRVGRLSGPDIATLERVHRLIGCPLVAAGGIASIADVERASAVPGVDGVVVGRAAYRRDFDLGAAIATVGR
jgi:phosphoribosylformimino-5-aminoimidazole carboxamide ribonucleotide (ProFAR) isomerase